MSNGETRQCPYCKEEIAADAIKCRYCQSFLSSEHGGVCPYCKEEVDPDATKCPHCKSDIGPTRTSSMSEVSRRDFLNNLGGYSGRTTSEIQTDRPIEMMGMFSDPDRVYDDERMRKCIVLCKEIHGEGAGEKCWEDCKKMQ